MKLLSYLINLFAVITVLFIGISHMDHISLGGIGFLIWAISPYIYTLFLVRQSKRNKVMKILLGVSIIVGISGIYLLADAMYIHPDPQSALVFVMLPVYQWTMILLTVLYIRVFSS